MQTWIKRGKSKKLDMDRNRFKTLMRCLTFMTFLAGSANLRSVGSGGNAVTVAPTCRVKGQPEVELVLHCGDGKYEGGVQFWHTPFGDLQPSALHTDLDSIFVHHDGSLVIPVPSLQHSGQYYCVLRHTEGTTLWPYELNVDHNQNTDDEREQDHSCAAHRSKRTIRPRSKDSDKKFAGAVVASVLLTFVAGFSAGALSRTHVLRCLQAVTRRLRSPKQRRRRQADVPDNSSQVAITTLSPVYDNDAFETETMQDNSLTCGNVEARMSVTTPSPPAKPKRSIRHKKEKEPEATAYLEGCDYTKEEMEVAGGSMGGNKEECDEEAPEEEETTQSSFYLEDEGTQSETDQDKSLDDSKETDEAPGEQNRSKEEAKREENEGEQNTEGKEAERCEELDRSTGAERSSEIEETTRNDSTEGEASSSAPRRRSRIIRVHQYDEDGQRYCHLPGPGSESPEPAPRLKQRSLSLTRLNAIMAAATAGPMDARASEETSHFHMEI